MWLFCRCSCAVADYEFVADILLRSFCKIVFHVKCFGTIDIIDFFTPEAFWGFLVFPLGFSPVVELFFLHGFRGVPMLGELEVSVKLDIGYHISSVFFLTEFDCILLLLASSEGYGYLQHSPLWWL